MNCMNMVILLLEIGPGSQLLGKFMNFLQTKPFQFVVFIDRTMRCNFLVKKYCFVSCKIIKIKIPKGKKLTKDDKLMLSKIVY